MLLRTLLSAALIAAPAVALARPHAPTPAPVAAPAVAPDVITVSLHRQELEVIGQALGQTPYVTAAPVIADLQRQVAAAMAPPLPAPSAAAAKK